MDFTGKIIVAVLDSSGNSGIYSTIKEINDLEADAWNGGVPTIKLRSTPNPKDGRMDNFKFQLDLTGMDPNTVRNIQVFASFDYNLDSMLRINMIGMMHVNIDTPNGAAMTYVDGLLNFMQDEPILIDSVER